ncbi:uncharacterized protein LOC112343134 [Selaginella moellendorffii]|uniref:uncharacterized protein LOC112343134 n=1 Tax=Selaginella moellendorffii TaxID=88036 RepID=UPI000D1D0270|nr:uncharacterized protein LOC112343134 [Selaginella moellendorffii]|eukprot:XP_024521878.1 uncharacterized protein LOC112343134 [Selaginella moellendorffii]
MSVKIQYKHGGDNKVADALSRMVNSISFMKLSNVLLDELKKFADFDSFITNIHAKVVKVDHQKLSGLYHPLRMARFFPVKTTIKASELAQLFVDWLFSLYGLLGDIVSDRDPKFTSKFWQMVFEKLETKLSMSSGEHPQFDGQIECMNQLLEDMLRSFVGNLTQQGVWEKYLPLLQFTHNSAHQSTIGMSPFMAMYGYEPRSLVSLNLALVRSLKGGGSAKLCPQYCGPWTILQGMGDLAYTLDLPASLKIHPTFHLLKAAVCGWVMREGRMTTNHGNILQNIPMAYGCNTLRCLQPMPQMPIQQDFARLFHDEQMSVFMQDGV